MRAETENLMSEEKEPEEKEMILETPEEKEMILETPEGQQDLRQGTKMESEKRMAVMTAREPTELELLKSIDKKLDVLLSERSV